MDAAHSLHTLRPERITVLYFPGIAVLRRSTAVDQECGVPIADRAEGLPGVMHFGRPGRVLPAITERRKGAPWGSKQNNRKYAKSGASDGRSSGPAALSSASTRSLASDGAQVNRLWPTLRDSAGSVTEAYRGPPVGVARRQAPAFTNRRSG